MTNVIILFCFSFGLLTFLNSLLLHTPIWWWKIGFFNILCHFLLLSHNEQCLWRKRENGNILGRETTAKARGTNVTWSVIRQKEGKRTRMNKEKQANSGLERIFPQQSALQLTSRQLICVGQPLKQHQTTVCPILWNVLNFHPKKISFPFFFLNVKFWWVFPLSFILIEGRQIWMKSHVSLGFRLSLLIKSLNMIFSLDFVAWLKRINIF